MAGKSSNKALLSRRNLIVGAAGTTLLGTAGAFASRASDKSGPRDRYFIGLQAALVDAGIAMPTLIIDKKRLDANIDSLMRGIPNSYAYRIVAKSLPSPAMISHISQRTGSQNLMSFNLPMLKDLSVRMPMADQLLGKPLPVAAAQSYFIDDKIENEARSNVQWLIDSPGRIRDYAELATSLNRQLRINIEIDVGLHRGGVTPGPDLNELLRVISENPHLHFSGFMGYAPHVGGIQNLEQQARAIASAWAIYEASLVQARKYFDSLTIEQSTRNAGGSSTFKLYKDTSVANEVAVGTALVKPNHYDIDSLSEFLPASYIATPVIKRLEETKLAGVAPWRDTLRRTFDPNLDHTLFVYGGNWMADPVDPPGLRFNLNTPPSSNQEMLNGGTQLNIERDEFVFYRPHQSEAVFLQFGDIALYEEGRISERWPVFPASA